MIRHTLIYLVAYALPGVLGTLSFSAYTRVLTPAEYAVYSVGISVAFLIGNVCFGWIRFSVGRFQAERPEVNFLPFVLTCLVVTSAVVVPVLLIGAFTTLDASGLAICGVLAMTVSQALFDITLEIRRARNQSIAFTKASVLRSVVGIGLSVAAAAYFHKGAAILFGTAAGFLVVGLIFLVQHRHVLTRRDIDPAMTRRSMTYGTPLTLSGLVFSGNATLARVIVTDLLGATAGGRYGAALDITGQLTNMIAAAVCSIMGPAAFRAYGTHGAEAARRELASGLELFVAILLPTTVGLTLVAAPFAAIMSGREFEAALGGLLPLLTISRALNVFSQFYLHLGFQIIEKPMRQVVCGGVTLLANVVLSLILTRLYGLTGAAVALLLADLCGVAVSFVLLRPVFPMPFPPEKILPIVVATGVMALACHAEQFLYNGPKVYELVLTVAAGVGSYAAMALILDIAGARTLVASRGYRSLVRLMR